jgi:hypothetical protein
MGSADPWTTASGAAELALGDTGERPIRPVRPLTGTAGNWPLTFCVQASEFLFFSSSSPSLSCHGAWLPAHGLDPPPTLFSCPSQGEASALAGCGATDPNRSGHLFEHLLALHPKARGMSDKVLSCSFQILLT